MLPLLVATVTTVVSFPNSIMDSTIHGVNDPNSFVVGVSITLTSCLMAVDE